MNLTPEEEEELLQGLRIINHFFPPLLEVLGFSYTLVEGSKMPYQRSKEAVRLLKALGRTPPTKKPSMIIATLNTKRKNPKKGRFEKMVSSAQWTHDFERQLMEGMGDLIIKISQRRESYTGLTPAQQKATIRKKYEKMLRQKIPKSRDLPRPAMFVISIMLPAYPEQEGGRELDEEWVAGEYGDMIEILANAKKEILKLRK